MAKIKTYPVPNIAWLWVTDFMHGWLQWELGGEARIGERRVVSVQHLPGARDILRMESGDDIMTPPKTAGASLSATRYNCYREGLHICPGVMEDTYGVTEASLELYVPIECPKMRLTKYGVLRPWTLDTCFGKDQARALQDLLRKEFWRAVEDFDADYAEKTGAPYPAKEMIEAFCQATRTPDMHVEAIRREWQRRQKRGRPAVTL